MSDKERCPCGCEPTHCSVCGTDLTALPRVTQERDDLEGEFIGELVAARRERDNALDLLAKHKDSAASGRDT